MRHIDYQKLVKLKTAGEALDERYGPEGSDKREAFHGKALSWYYGEILRDRRKALKMTQKELADKVGTARSYISRVEKGETDIQMSSFLKIAKALRIEFSPMYV